MIVKVIPLRRLPRDIETFDYAVPDELKDKIRPGQLVTIPFRKSDILGLVLTIDGVNATNGVPLPHRERLPIKTIVNESPLLSAGHLCLLQKLARRYGVSLGTLTLWSLPPLKKRKLRGMPLEHLSTGALEHAFNHSHRIVLPSSVIYHIYNNDFEHASNLSSAINGYTLILVPLVHLINEVYTLLTAEQKEQTIIWHGELSEKDQFDRWVQIRNGEKTIIIGTRSAIFLPFGKLDRIIIDYEHDENHKHWDQAPRFHVKDVVPLIAETFGAEIHMMSFSPSCEAYFYVAKGRYNTPPSRPDGGTPPFVKVGTCAVPNSGESVNVLPFTRGGTTTAVGGEGYSSIHLIDLRDERRAGRFGMIADEIKEAILLAKEDIFIYINRLGFSTSVSCQACGRNFACSNCKLPFIYHNEKKQLICHYCKSSVSLPATCPTCHSPRIDLRGIGTEFVEKGVRELLRSQGDDNNPSPFPPAGRSAVWADKKKAGMKYNANGAVPLPQRERLGKGLNADAPAAINQSQHSIIRIDSLSTPNLSETNQSRIIIGTHMALPYIRWDKTELVILLGLDQQLSIPEYRASENVWHLIQEIQYRSGLRYNADIVVPLPHRERLGKGLNADTPAPINRSPTIIIQTFHPDHLVFRGLKEPDRFYRTELNARKKTGYPPYRYLVRYFYGDMIEIRAKKSAEKLYQTLKQELTTAKKDAILSAPIQMQPSYFRRRYWYAIVVKLNAEMWQEDLEWMNSLVPMNWRIDPNPISPLSP